MKKGILYIFFTFTAFFLVGCQAASSYNDWLTYRDGNNFFQIQYPSTFWLNTNNGTGDVSINYPDTYLQGTNLEGARIDMKVDHNQACCTKSEYNQHDLTKTSIINNITFYKDNWIEGVAGHKIEHVGYYTFYDGKCFKIILSLYSANMEIYANGQGGYLPGSPQPFDREKTVDIFEQIMTTFTFE